MSDMKIQGEFEMDTTKGEDALARVESNARRMANTIKQAGDQAANAMGGLGDKAEQSAKGIERANAAIATAARKAVSESQRAIVEAQGYSLKSAEGLEQLARLRGADVNAISGQLTALKTLRAEQEAMVSAQREAASADLFERQHVAAKKLVQDAEYVRAWTSALDLLDAKQREIAALPAFERERQAADQARRRTDATIALSQALDIQEARERELAALPTFLREQAAADQARRRADATAALTQVLEQQEAAERKLASQNGFLSSLQGQTDSIGKTRSELLAMQAAQLGVSDKAAPMIARLREQEAGFGKLATSAGQTRAALAQLPMQFSDIVVSLQGGQAPLTVFLQQGAQIKDSFGGAGAALKAMGGYVLGLVNPLTAAAAAAALLAVAYNQGSKEADGYRMAIITTGNAAGTTAAQMQAYAQAISATVGTQGKAAESISELVATGKVAASVLRVAGAAAVYWEQATGQAVGKTAEQFASLRNDPLSAVLKLNEGMNFLTESTYRQIKSLSEQGKTADAARVAQEAYADALTSRSKQIEQNLGYIEAGWKKVKDAAKGGWDAMLNVGRSSTPADALGELRARLEAQQRELATKRAINPAADTSGMDKGIDILKQRIGLLESDERQLRRNAEAEAARANQMRAAQVWDKDGAKYLSDKAKLERELTQARNEGIDAGKSQAEIEERLNKIREEFAKKGGGAGAAKAEQSAYATLIASVKARIEQNEQEISSGAKLNDAQKLRAQLTAQLESGSRKMTAAHQAEAKALLDTLDASERKLAVSQAQRKFEAERDKEAARIAEEIGNINEKARALEDEAAVYGKTATELRALTIARLEDRKAMLTSIDDKASQDELASINARIAAVERLGAAETKIADLKLADYSDEQLRAARELASLYEDESRLVGLSSLERAKVVALRQVELKYAKELEKINKSTASDDAKAAARIEALETKQIESQAVVAKVIEDDWNKTSQLIGDTLADYIMGGGKDAAQYLKRLFATLVLQPVVQMGVSGVLGGLGLGGAGGGGGSGVLGMAQNAYSAYNTGSQLYTIGGQVFGGTMSGANAAGTLWANTTGGGLDALLATNGAYGTSTGGAGAGASMFSGGGGSLAGFGAFAAVAALALNALGAFRSERIAGSGLTGTLGGDKDLQPYALWREGGTLFSGPRYSMKSPGEEIARYEEEIARLRAEGKGGTETIAGLEEQVQYLKDTYGAQIAAAKKQSDAIQATYDAMRTSVGDMADVLGISSEAVRKFTMAVGTDLIHPDTGGYGLNFSNLSEDEIIAKVDEALRTANNTLAEQVIGTWKTITEEVRRTVMVSPTQWGDNYESAVYREDVETVTRREYVESEYAREGEKAIDTLTRLATSLSTVNTVFENLGQTLYESSLAGGDMASMLLDLFGGAENFGAATGTYFQNFYSEDEQRAAMQRQLDKQLATLDLKLPDIDAADARAQYRRLAEAQDLTTESGRKAYVMLMQLAGAFAGITAEAEDAKKAEEDRIRAAEKARKDLIDSTYSLFQRALSRDRDALSEQASAISEVISAISSSVDMLNSNARELYGTVDSTAQMLAAQGMVYIEQALAGVRGGKSLTGYEGLTDAISAARGGISGGNYATEFDRQRDTLVLAGQLSELGELGDLQLSVEERQLKGINAQLDALEALGKRADALVNGTQELTDTVDGYFAKLIAILAPEKTPGTGGAAGGGSGASYGPTWGGTSTAPKYSRPVSYTGGVIYQGVSQEEEKRLDQYASGYHAFDGTGDAAGLNAWIAENNLKPSDLSALSGLFGSDWEAWFKANGLSFAVGTNYVPHDMVAQIHKGERIIPEADNRALIAAVNGGGQGGDVQRLEALVGQLIEDRRKQSGEILRLQNRLAKVLEKWDVDGMPKPRDEEAIA